MPFHIQRFLGGRILLCCVALILAIPAFSQLPDTPPHVPEATEDPVDVPPETMFPHFKDTRFWLSGQANFIFQTHPDFHAPYSGPHSLDPHYEKATSRLLTLYTGARINNSTEFVVDIEEAGGAALTQGFGLAGNTDLDIVRNPSLSKAPYLGRAMIHHVFAFSSDKVENQRNAFSLFEELPRRRLEFRFGKMSLPDFLDINSVGSDTHFQFINWTTDNNGAWDYAADTRGYTVGGIAEYDDRAWSVRYGIFSMPVVANGIDLDWAWSRAHGQNWELEVRRSLLPKRKGTSRLLFYANRAHMGVYREAVDAYLNGTDPTPTITAHEHFGSLKYGFGYNVQQMLTENLRVFGRFGWNEGQHESYAYTEVDQTVEIGGDFAGRAWHRTQDKIGLAVVSNAIKRDHQNYLHYGGLGFLLGDGNLNYGRENIVESYYDWHAWRGMFYAIDVQHVSDPGYNRDRGPAWVGSVRAHVDF
jgi:hypothetical protein